MTLRPFAVLLCLAALAAGEVELPNPGFEQLDAKGLPLGWTARGPATCTVDSVVRHAGTHAIAVANAAQGGMAGWSTLLPARLDRAYRLSGWAKGGKLAANGFVPGGAFQIEFLDAAGAALGAPVQSTAVGPQQEWSELSTPAVQPPPGCVRLRLTAGLDYCNGTAWFDDLALAATPATPLVASRDDCQVRIGNAVPGNCLRDPAAAVKLPVTLTSKRDGPRRVTLRAELTDWKGKALPTVELAGVALVGTAPVAAELVLPGPGAYGSYFIDLTVSEGADVVGTGSGRFAELPALDRPRTHPPIWGVTPLEPIVGDGRPYERELAELFRLAGFGITWVRLWQSTVEPATVAANVAKLRPVLAWYRSLGIRPVLQIIRPYPRWRPVQRPAFVEAGRIISKGSADLVLAYGNHSIETANSSATTYRGGNGGERLTDDEYDTMLSGFYEGLKAEAPQIPVLIGNIATDWEAKTVRRLYGPPANGAFDGAILNAYLGVTMTILNNLKEMDAHGDTAKGIWQEETASQRSPCAGAARRYGEGEGAASLVRAWLEPVIKAGDRLKAFTMWGFTARGIAAEDDIAMVSKDLQPRPQFVAHAVMADALADATLVGDRSAGGLTCGAWTRGDGTLLVLWAGGGSQDVTLEAPRGELTVMDVMGNRRQVRAVDGVAVIAVGSDPLYCFAGGEIAFSRRLEVAVGYGTRRAGTPLAQVTLRSNQDAATTVRLAASGPLSGAGTRELSVPAHGSATVDLALDPARLDPSRRSVLAVGATTPSGAVFVASRSFDAAVAVRATAPVPLSGGWEGPWRNALPIVFGRSPDEVIPAAAPGERYDGEPDILGRLRLLWDERCLYLGVEALDDAHQAVGGRGESGFMGDAIEFALQPDAILSNLAPRYEYELFLPAGECQPVLNRRFPSAGKGPISGWAVGATPTGRRGDLDYQVAIPWSEFGATAPVVGRVLSLGVLLDDTDTAKGLHPGRCRIQWFRGVDTKNTEGFGDVVLVEAK